MKIAVGIIGIVMGLLVLLQSCAVTMGGHLTDNNAIGEAGSVGLLVGIIFFIAGAFAFGLPMVSVIGFVFAAVLAFAVSGEFTDMKVWAFASLMLAVLSFFAWRSKRKDRTASKGGLS